MNSKILHSSPNETTPVIPSFGGSRMSRPTFFPSFVISLLAALFATVLVLALPSSAYASGDEASIELAQGAESANVPFSVSGMLPGDVESQGIELDVSHSAPLTVQFEVERTEDREGDSARLSEALHLRVVDRLTGSVAAEGSASELTGKAVPIPVSGEGVTRLSWTVEASLPTSVGNEYQNTACVLDLHWFVSAEESSSLAPLAKTGDAVPFWVFVAAAIVVAALCAAAYARYRATRAAAAVSEGSSSLTAPGMPAEGEGRAPLDSQTKKNIFVSAFFVFALLLVAASIAVALFYAHERLPENRFATGTVSLALEGGFNEEGLEPGRTVMEDFTITNTGSADAYWRMSFDNLQGPLSGALDVTVLDETGAVLYQGSAVELDRGASYAQSSRVLASGQSETFTVQVSMNEGARNDYQGTGVAFDVRVDGVQSKNNEAGEF